MCAESDYGNASTLHAAIRHHNATGTSNLQLFLVRTRLSEFNEYWTTDNMILHDRSILEEEGERGLAHIVEHMAFSGTKKYANKSIIKFLESIGAPLGPCSNAFTSCDQTTYEFLIPIDKPDILPEALDILSEFATEVSNWLPDLGYGLLMVSKVLKSS